MLAFKNLCGKCFGELFDKQGQKFLNSKLVCHHFENELKENNDKVEYSLDYFENSILILSNPANLDNYFLLDDYEKSELLNFAKPILTVTIKDEELKNKLQKQFIKTKVIDSAPLSVEAYKLFQEEIPYFFIAQKQDDFEIFVHKNKSHIINPSLFSAPLYEATLDNKYNLIYNYLQEFSFVDTKTIIFRANKNTLFEFFIYENNEATKVLDISKLITKNILKTISTTSGSKERLIDNFKLQNQELFEKIVLATNENISLFELCSVILGANIFDLSMEFIGNGGLKLDMKFTNSGFDIVSLIGSILSYKLAGVEDKIIAFSLFESVADFGLHLLSELKTRYEIENFVFFGDIFTNQVFFSRIEKNGSYLNPKISTTFKLDV